MPGYDAFPLQDGVVLHERLKCYHCQLVMKEPVQTKKTGLLFCRECFNETLKNSESLQPGDQEAWPDNAVKRDINSIPVLCVYHGVGCEWRGLFKDYFEHTSVCECRTNRYKEELYSDTVKENSEAIPVSLSGPAPTEQLMIGVGTQQLSKSTENVIPSVQPYDESLPSPPLDQTHFNTYMQETLDSIQSKLASMKQNDAREDVIANMKEAISGLRRSLADMRFTVDNHREELIEIKVLAASNNVFCNGKFTWPIRDVSRLRDAMLGRRVRIFSPPFYTKPDGYKMCVCLYLNGYGAGEGTHLSVYFALMKGEYDALQQWPFEHKVNLILVDQDKKDDITLSFNPAGPDNPFTRPSDTHELNLFSGFTKFVPLSILSDPRYVKDDAMFIRATVDVDTRV